MSPVHRRLAADLLYFDLDQEMDVVRSELAAGHARIARTLVKEGPLRLTLVGLAVGGALQRHQAEAPVCIHVLEGDIILEAGEEVRAMRAGQMAALDARVPHAVRAPQGAMILLTLAAASPPAQE